MAGIATGTEKQAASFSSLPEELIERICQIILNTQVSETPLRDLSNLCLTSKLLDRIARPSLYKDVELQGIVELCSFTKCIAKQPELAKAVRSLTIVHDRDDEGLDIDFDALLIEIGNQDLRTERQFDRLVLDGSSQVASYWVLIVEFLLSRTSGLIDLDINVDGENACGHILPESQFGESNRNHEVLPHLRKLTVREANKTEDLLAMIKSLCRNGVDSLTCIDCGVPQHIAAIEGETAVSVGTSITIRKIRCYNSSEYICPVYVPTLIRSCPSLEEFHFLIAENEDEDDEDDDEEEISDPFTASDIIHRFEGAKRTLKSLSLTTESFGDDDGFPSLRGFEALEHLRLDIFELADYDDHAHDVSDEDSEPDNDSAIPQNQDNDDNDQQETPGAHDPEWEDIDTDSSSDDSSDGGEICKPILHLLPKSLKTLWLDNLYTLDGDLDAELIKLARTARDDFPNFKQITIEGAEELEDCDILQAAFEKAGIEFVKKPLRHFWSVEEGLAKVRDPESEKIRDVIDTLCQRLDITDFDGVEEDEDEELPLVLVPSID